MTITVNDNPAATSQKIRSVSVPLERGGNAQIDLYSDGRVLVYVAAGGASFFWHLDAKDVPDLADGLNAAIGAKAPKRKRGAK